MILAKPENTITRIGIIILVLLMIVAFAVDNNWMYMIIPLFIISLMIFPIDMNDDRLFIKYILVYLIVEVISEGLAVLQNLPLPNNERALFHPDPILDIIISILYYLPLALVSYYVFSKYKYSIKGVFIIGGLYGIMTEQSFSILLSFNILLWVVVFILYGSFLTIPYVIFQNKFNSDNYATINYLKLLFAYIIGLIFAYILFAIMYTIFPILRV